MPPPNYDPPSSNGYRVLVADPAPDGAVATAALLMFNGFETGAAGTAAAALAQADFAPHAVVVDLDLPGGVDVVGWAKALPVPAGVVVAGRAVPAVLRGADAAVLVKPVDPRDLVDQVLWLCEYRAGGAG
jgi:DNA-binding response OmpR family regulator